MGTVWIVAVTAYLVVAIIAVMWALVALWPPLKPNKQVPAPTASPSPSPTASATPTPGGTATPSGRQTPATRPTPTPTPQQTPTPTVASSASPNATANPPSSAGGNVGAACAEENRIKGEYCLDEKGEKREGVSPARVFGWCGCMYDEDRLLFIVLLAGAFGSLIHGLRSFVWYVGNRRAVRSWSAFYIALPFIGSGLAFIFYLVIRGGFFSPSASAELTSPVGFAAVAALIGMFTEQAVIKLKGVSETILSPAEKGKDHIDGPKVTAIAPAVGPPEGGNEVKISGENFTKPVKVKFGVVDATIVGEPSPTSLTVTVPAHPELKEEKVDVVITNSDDQHTTERAAYEYKRAAPPGGAQQPATGVNSQETDTADVHDVDLKPDTGDEELPISEGGVG